MDLLLLSLNVWEEKGGKGLQCMTEQEGVCDA
jgi:hypothetical protein